MTTSALYKYQDGEMVYIVCKDNNTPQEAADFIEFAFELSETKFKDASFVKALEAAHKTRGGSGMGVLYNYDPFPVRNSDCHGISITQNNSTDFIHMYEISKKEEGLYLTISQDTSLKSYLKNNWLKKWEGNLMTFTGEEL